MLAKGNMMLALAQTNRETRNVYFKVLDRNPPETTDVTSQAQYINSLLSEAKTRAIGLRFIIDYLNQCSHNIIQEKASHWLSIIIRACNVKEVGSYGELIYEALALLVIKIQTVADTSKCFGTMYLLKFYESLSLMEQETSLCCTIAVLKSIKQCLKYYPGPSKCGRHLVMRYLVTILDSNDQDVVYQSGCCWLLLQQVRNNSKSIESFNDKTEWQYYQIGLLGNLNTLLYQTFPNYKNVFNTTDISYNLKPFVIILQGDPIERAAHMFRRFWNIIEFLKIALSHPYPSHKLMHPFKILNLVQRGLEINSANCGSGQSIDDTLLAHFLPQIHIKLLELLEVLIDICHTHLRVQFRVITDLLLETLKNTKGSLLDGSQIQSIYLRCKVYKVTMLWLNTFFEGNGYDLIIEHLIKNIFEDTQICQPDICLVFASPSQKSPEYKRKDSTTPKQSFQKKIIINGSSALVCVQALRSLQAVLASLGHLLKPSLLMDIFTSILEIGFQIVEKRIIVQKPYSDWKSRLEVYKTLFTFIRLRNIRFSQPTEIILHILKKAHNTDPSLKVRNKCKLMIDAFGNVIHPIKESFIIKFHAEKIQCASTSIKPQQNLIYKRQVDCSQNKEDFENYHLDKCNISTIKLSKSIYKRDSEFIPLGILHKTEKATTCIDKAALIAIPFTVDDDKNISDEIKTTTKLQTEKKSEYNSIAFTQSNKCDDDYIAELEAAFVDELK